MSIIYDYSLENPKEEECAYDVVHSKGGYLISVSELEKDLLLRHKARLSPMMDYSRNATNITSRIDSIEEYYQNSYAKWDRSIAKRRRFSFF